ncbi:hypothetical protein C0581_03100 [Candidatus Parcubacteria bacterium]|nr:MAG: hypothetical protein C0581_03100 [Candidatus Parcubacteria bacterium]
MKKAVIYTRVSSEEQIKGSSLDEQGKKCKYLIKSQDWDVGDVYQDGGRGGENIERPELQRLMSDAKEGKFDAVVVYKVDRLSRSLKDFLELQDYFTSHSVELISVLEPFDTSTPTGRLFINMLGSFAEFEHSQIKERINMGQKAYMRKGNWKGNAPYGYDVKNKKLVIKKDEAKVIKKMFKLVSERCYDTNRLTLMKLQKIVNSWDVPTKKAGNNKKESDSCFWVASTIRNILKNHVYTGVKQVNKLTKNPNKEGNKRIIKPKEEWIEIRVPAIISQEVFDRVQMALKRNSEFAWRKSKKNEDKLLAKIIYCTECGRKYTYWNAHKKQKTYYYCQGTKQNRRSNKCTASYIADYRIEEPVWNRLKEFILNPSLIEK